MLNNQEIKPPVLINELGMQFPTEKSKTKARFGIFRCSCGNEFKTIITSVKTGNTKSCGCLNIMKIKKRNTSHGLRYHPIYDNWKNMIQRCNNKNYINYENYGGRGVEVCERWKSVKNFIDDMYPTYKDGLSLDRINPYGNYEPSNCRWATNTTQARNTRVLSKANKSGFRGVSWNNQSKKWQSTIKINNIPIYLGIFTEKIDAAKAYNQYVIDNNLEHTINAIISKQNTN